MIDLALDDPDRLDAAEINTLNHHRGRIVLGRVLTAGQRQWVEGVLARLGKTGDIGPVENYAERRFAMGSFALTEDWRLGPKVLKPPRRLP